MSMGTSGLDATNEAYRKRAGLDKDVTVVLDEPAADEAADDQAPEEPVSPPSPEVVEAEGLMADIFQGKVSEDLRADEPTPDMSWKKEEIINYVEESDVDGDRDDLEKLTKAQLIERLTEG